MNTWYKMQQTRHSKNNKINEIVQISVKLKKVGQNHACNKLRGHNYKSVIV